jgi:hypothetical protein
MNFQVPQFIEIEDKPIGPFTFKQFLYLAGGAGICFIIWTYAPFRFLAVILMAPVAILALALAFYKINNRPFILIMEAALKYWISKKLYTWKKTEDKVKTANLDSLISPQSGAVNIPRLSGSKLSDLAWSLDIQEKVK